MAYHMMTLCSLGIKKFPRKRCLVLIQWRMISIDQKTLHERNFKVVVGSKN